MTHTTDIKQALAAQLVSVQEPVAWVERWYGSGQEHGWWIWEKHSLTHGQAVAWIGNGPFAERLTSIIVEKAQRRIVFDRARKGTVCT
jgi:hypothetical protein